MGKIITIKNNKGGVGKTFLTTQLAAGLSYLDKKVLILTSDPQNNVFDYLFKGDERFERGLKAEVLKGNGEYFRMRSELYFLPLEDGKFSNQFLKELPIFLEKSREKFDYILIDASPTIKIDSVFTDCSDAILIPFFANSVTLNGIIKLCETVDIKKIKSIVTTNFQNTVVQKEYYNLLKDNIGKYGIEITEPIRNLSFIESMLDARKTIWEFNNKTATEVQKIFFKILKDMENY